MFKRIKIISKVFLCLLAAISSFFITYRIYRPINKANEEINFNANNIKLESNIPEVQPAVAYSQQKIKPSTKIIYEYYYETDDLTRKVETEVPYFLIDMTFEQVQKFFHNWTVKSFSSENVILRTNIKNQNSNNYIIGIHNGYIAVFYEEELNGISLNKVTDTPINSLPVEEQQKLERGIYVKGEELLNKYLEDYGS